MRYSPRFTVLFALAVCSQVTHGQVIPFRPGTETAAFQHAQKALLARYGVYAKARYVRLKQPAISAHVISAGRGAPVVLIHGGGGFGSQFAPLMGALQKDFRVYAVDRPGCGLSDKFDYRSTHLRKHAVDFVGGVLDGLGLKKATLVGASMGGLWVLQYALAHPERVTALVLLGEPAGSPPVMTNAPPPWSGSLTIDAIRRSVAARQVADISRVPAEYFEAAFAARLLPGAEVSWNSLIEKFTKDDERTYHLRPELKNLRPPTLFIWGDQDRLGPPSLGEEMANLARNGRCEVLRDAGHLVWLDQPEPCSQSIRRFLKPSTHAPPFRYVQAKAYHILPETTTEESGYFALSEGKNGKIYIGTAAYGRNSYLVEFDPKTEKQRIVLDTHKLVGLPLAPTGYAAQAKLHTRNFVGPSGKIYVGSKQGYPTEAEKAAAKRGEKIPTYRGGYVMVYDPKTDTAENLGMPMPLDEKMIAAGKTEGQGVIDVTADEARGLVYVITCEEQRWVLYDVKTRKFRELGPILRDQPNTLIDAKGRATAITADYRIARYEPDLNRVTISPMLIEGRPFGEYIGPDRVHPDWRLASDGRTAYLQLLNDLRLFRIDLSGAPGEPVIAENLGNRVEGQGPDSRGSISIAPDGRVYSVVRVDNKTGFGTGYLHQLIRYDPKRKKMEDLGVITVRNPDFFDFSVERKNPDGSLRPRHGFHTLPDGTLTPLHVILATIVARDGTVWATTIYPFTLLRIDRPR